MQKSQELQHAELTDLNICLSEQKAQNYDMSNIQLFASMFREMDIQDQNRIPKAN